MSTTGGRSASAARSHICNGKKKKNFFFGGGPVAAAKAGMVKASTREGSIYLLRSMSLLHKGLLVLCQAAVHFAVHWGNR